MVRTDRQTRQTHTQTDTQTRHTDEHRHYKYSGRSTYDSLVCQQKDWNDDNNKIK